MRNKKLIIIISLLITFVLVLVFSVIIPTFSNYQNELDNPEWNGMIASGFKSGSGTIEDPYIISTPNELAFFAVSMENEDYEGKYIKLTSDIVINKGIFKDNTYIYNDNTYYMNNDDKYYSDENCNHEMGSINIFPVIDGFKGHFEGDFHTIYGLYERNNNTYNSLFINFSGVLQDLYIDNAYISGGIITAGVISNATNATINNIIFNGNIISNNQTHEEEQTIELEDFVVTDSITKTIDIPIISNIPENTLKGTCSGTDTFTLNNNTYTCDDFEIEVSNSFEITVSATASFTNVSYNLTYDENKTSGIVGLASNSELDGLVNKGNIQGIYTSGIVGTILNTNLKNSYNNGKISGTRSSGIIDTVIYSNNYLRNVYNNGEILTGIKAGLISNIYNSNLTIDKSFNTYNTYMINNILSSSLVVQNSSNIENYTDNYFSLLNYETISSFYPTYTNNENIINGNIWVQEEDLPILYFDDMKNKTVQVVIGDKTWDSLHLNLQDLRYNEEIEVLITTTDIYKPIKNVWYYPSNIVLNKNDLANVSWAEYDGKFTLNNNVYILYIKYEDYNDNTYYINTDKLIIGNVSVNVAIKSDNNIWNTYHTPVTNYNNKNISYEIIDNNTSLLISNIEYLISSIPLSIETLENAHWISYNNRITPIDDSYIIYVKVTDISSNIIYLNTDKMIDMSFEISNIKSGNNISFSNYMTYNSSFSFDISLIHKESIPNYSRYIKVDKQLPNNTIITLRDKNGIYYEYVVTSHNFDSNLNCYLYPFSLFKKVGKITFDEYYIDDNNNGSSNENYNIMIDLKNVSNTTNDYILSVIAKGTNTILTQDGQEVEFHLVNQDTNTLSITSNFNNTIDYGVDNTYTVGLTTSLNPVVLNTHNITNTNYENLYEGLYIEVYDQQNHIVSRDDLEAIRFIYNNTTYVFDRNNRININLGQTKNQSINLQIITSKAHTNLDGTYYFKIKGYLSIDGINKKYNSTNVVSIPLRFIPSNDLNYGFDVQLTQPIINKGNSVSFDITYTGDLDNPNLRVSLYRKKELTAYNQEYELVDLQDYVSNRLDEVDDSIYGFNVNDIELSLLNNIERNGYKFVFELYDDDTKKSEIDIKTIIK